MKTEIIEQLGQADILLPQLIAQGLLANDRVKARLGVLQAAGRHARDPDRTRFDLMDECRVAGIDSIAAESLGQQRKHDGRCSSYGARPR